MSDTPSSTDEPKQGGWHTPESAGSWREPEQEEQPAGWRVPTLPKELEEEPEQAGVWHLPKPDDTIFTPEDETEIQPEDESAVVEDTIPIEVGVPPEDEILASLQVSSSATVSAPEAEDPVAPEDLMYMLEHMDDEEPEDEASVPMSELIALASLTEDVSYSHVIQAEDDDSPDISEVVESIEDEVTEDEAEIAVDQLSPAERLMLQTDADTPAEPTSDVSDPAAYARQQLAMLSDDADDAPPVSEEFPEIDESDAALPNDPAAYARQQLEALGGGGDPQQSFDLSAEPEPDDAPTLAESDPAAYARLQLEELGLASDDANAGDPGAYARQQLAQLDNAPVGDFTPIPTQTQPFDTREQEMTRRFRETEDHVMQLREQVQAGQITQADYEAQLRNLMILDDDQFWWMMGSQLNDTNWYKSVNNQWVVDTPPHLTQFDLGDVSSPYSSYQDQSLPVLPDDPYQEVSGTSQVGEAAQGIRLDENFMPLPKEVPVEDPDYTVPSGGAFRINEPAPSSQATVPSAAYSSPTIQSDPIPDYGSIEAPIDESAPPDYDAMLHEGEVFREAADKQRTSTLRILIGLGVIGIVIVLLGAAAFIAAALLWYQGIVGDWETQIAALGNFEPEFQTVTILDNRGERVATLAREGDDRRPVAIEDMSPYLLHATIALENPRFYEDGGWDPFAIVRAFAENLAAGEITSGASTITQQVARNLVLQNTDVSAERKINEIVVAGELTRRFDKSEILELYLNEVAFFGNQTYGVEAAAQFYFDKPASELTLPEAAMLMAINNAPATNEPVNNREVALELMLIVMDRMKETGCLTFEHNGQTLCVDDALLDSGQTVVDLAMVEAQVFEPREFGVRYPHYIQRVQAELEAMFGSTEIYSGGYVVTTTLDSRLQETVQTQLAERVRQLSTTGVNTGAVMVTDPRNGAILAMVGSPDFSNAEIDGQVNGALTWQQPGSSIKPIVYTTALNGVDRNANGVSTDPGEYLTAASILWDVPTTYSDGYTPVNFDRQFRGPVASRLALQNSYNIPAIKTFEFIGVEAFRSMAEGLGLNFLPESQFNLTTAVGSTDVRLIDMMKAYGSLANDGFRTDLFTIENVVDSEGNGVPIPQRPEAQPVLSNAIAYLMQNILSDDRSRQDQFGLNSTLTINGLNTIDQVAAKTGTSNDGRDLWTMGFTTNRVVGVWLGTFDNQPTFNTTGFTAASPLWNSIMRVALEGNNPGSFVPPENGTVVNRRICATTGTEPDDACPNPRNEFFSVNHPPPGPEEGFAVVLQVDSWTGLIANNFCPDQVIDTTFANITDNSAINWLNTSSQGQAYAQTIGLQIPVSPAPTQACDQNTPIPVARISNPNPGSTQVVEGVLTITGQVNAEGFNRYDLQYALTGTDEWETITTSTQLQPNAGSVLGSWDTTSVPNGSYTVRLAVFANNGGFLYRTADIRTNNPEPTPTPLPTATLTIPPTPAPNPTQPIPFDTLPTPTVDPLG